MKIVVFGLTISSSWGNGHATLWRGLCRALGDLGHSVVFFERDVPYYAGSRDGAAFPGCDLRLYPSWEDALRSATREVETADVAMVTSYCPDGPLASELVLRACPGLRMFYDLDTPVTLEKLEAGQSVPYLPPGGLGDFDWVLSYTGGGALDALKQRLGARRVAPLYGSVDPRVHRPASPEERFRADLTYLGTHAEDRRRALEELFVRPASRLPDRRFFLAGALYPDDFVVPSNVVRVSHVPPGDHAALFASCALSLNVTRGAMARWGYCPSGRLFEAAASGVPQISDAWQGLDAFFRAPTEILVARTADDVVAALSLPREELACMAREARRRALEEHTCERRASELVAIARGDMRRTRPETPRAQAREARDTGADRDPQHWQREEA